MRGRGSVLSGKVRPCEGDLELMGPRVKKSKSSNLPVWSRGKGEKKPKKLCISTEADF